MSMKYFYLNLKKKRQELAKKTDIILHAKREKKLKGLSLCPHKNIHIHIQFNEKQMKKINHTHHLVIALDAE